MFETHPQFITDDDKHLKTILTIDWDGARLFFYKYNKVDVT